MKTVIYNCLKAVRTESPLVHNITNYVVMNNTANALLAAGASPVMAHSLEEMEDFVSIASALVINIGTLSPLWVESMKRAMKTAAELNKPVILDPVGAGATPYRTETVRELIETAVPAIIRGNASEIISLTNSGCRTRGVDSSEAAPDALDSAYELARNLGCVVCISGPDDYITDGRTTRIVHNGNGMMRAVTGMGCTASALTGAFAGVESDPLKAGFSAMAVMGLAGEIAAEKAAGPGSLQLNFLDVLYNLNEEDFDRLRVE